MIISMDFIDLYIYYFIKKAVQDFRIFVRFSLVGKKAIK